MVGQVLGKKYMVGKVLGEKYIVVKVLGWYTYVEMG